MLEVFWIFLRLGLTSFGGPIAHLSYFHDEFVKRKKWINEHAYADLVALCQFLPGPASSQVGMAIGLSRAGVFGAIMAWIGFTLPSAILLVLFGLGLSHFSSSAHSGWLHGLKIAAVAVVAQAVWAMGKKLCTDKERVSLAILTAVVSLVFVSSWIPILLILIGGVFGAIYFKKIDHLPHNPISLSISRRLGAFFLFLFFSILCLLPFLEKVSGSQSVKLFDSFFRVGSLVFGGGHVVLPLLQSEVVETGFVSKDFFVAGYGAAQAIPGPLFSFSAYLGAVANGDINGWSGAFLCLVAAFLPSFLLIIGVLPFWEKIRKDKKVRSAMLGINAVVVGLLLAAFYSPVWVSTILLPLDFCIAMTAFLLLDFWKLPSWLVVILCAFAGFLTNL